jgi:hypothetical protein
MGLITVNNDSFSANVVVQEIGDLGVATLQVNDKVKHSPVLGFFTVRFASSNGFIGVLFHILSVIDVGLT